MILNEKIENVKNLLKDKKVAIAFSGGADSTLLAYLSSKVAEKTLAISIDNHIMPTNFIENCIETAENFNIDLEIVDIDFYEKEDILANKKNRCYLCRQLMYEKIVEIANKRECDFVIDGNNISDLLDDRPGILITYSNNIKTPFIDCYLTSKEIHQYLDNHNIRYSKSTTCIATRIARNTKITEEKINLIKDCEDFVLSNTNCEIVKIRDMNNLYLLELDTIDDFFDKNKLKTIVDKLKLKGLNKLALNLSTIEEYDGINIDYNNGSFKYELPYTINIENTSKIAEKKITKSDDNQIIIKNITINKNGVIKGKNFNNRKEALLEFLNILPYIRRNI